MENKLEAIPPNEQSAEKSPIEVAEELEKIISEREGIEKRLHELDEEMRTLAEKLIALQKEGEAKLVEQINKLSKRG